MAFLAGAAVGAMLGLLYAPEKGSVTREKLSGRLDKYKKMLEDFINGLGEEQEAPSSTAGSKSPSGRVVSEAKDKAEKLLEDVDELLSQIRGNKKS